MTLTSGKLRWLLIILGLVTLPHFWHLHLSHSGLFALCWGWRWLAVSRPHWLPRARCLPVLTLAAALVVIGTAFALDLTTSTGLFVVGLGLKLMELNQARDVYLAVLLGWFVALTQCLYDQSLSMAAYLLVTSALTVAWLVQFHATQPLSGRGLVAWMGKLYAAAIGPSVLLFLGLPRVQGGFFLLPVASSAVTGLAETMAPGTIARLATSAQVAFRVDFVGPPPPPAERYWRAQVLWRFDGQSWLPEPAFKLPLAAPFPGLGEPVSYQVIIEPHRHRWLFSLGIPGSIPEGVRLIREGVLESFSPVTERRRYRLRSYPAYRFPPLWPSERQMALQLPHPPSTKVQALVERLKGHGDYPQAVLEFFRAEGFRYTLEPGQIEGDFIERFLFETRAGFCEHYASAFVYLLRAAGIPARVVTGYLGGFVHPRGFIEVYQANAHAWAEGWDEARGWVRYDPTRAVAPGYVEQVQDLPAPLTTAEVNQLAAPAQSHVPAPELWSVWEQHWRILWSDLDYRWQQWVLGYDQTAQDRLLAALAPYWPWLALFAAGILGGIGSRRRLRDGDRLVHEYQAYLRHLKKRYGVGKFPSETPQEFAVRAGRLCPQEAERLRRITEVLIAAHYGRQDRIQAAQAIRRLSNG